MANNVLSVSQINKYIAGMFRGDYLLNRVSVKGEIGTCTYQASGHIYFSIKDANSNMPCVMWASKRAGLKCRLQTGMQVIVTGSVEVYEQAGKYQIICSKIEEDGIGDIYERFEALKKKLEEQGMFDAQYKRPIPKYVKTLGVVTAGTGAAVRDIINISKRRNPGIQLILFPAIVQGQDAPESIIKGIRALENYGVDCMIVGRGGGSMEDLWCFNDEGVANAIFNSTVPVISAVGHETDFTIADFVSDLRAPTPSAAAELAVFDVRLWTDSLEQYESRFRKLMNGRIATYRNYMGHYEDKLRLANPINVLNEKRNRLVALEERLNVRMNRTLEQYKNRLAILARELHGASPLNKLGGGYAYISGKSGAIGSVEDIKTGETITVNLTDGTFNAQVTEVNKEIING